MEVFDTDDRADDWIVSMLHQGFQQQPELVCQNKNCIGLYSNEPLCGNHTKSSNQSDWLPIKFHQVLATELSDL